MVVNVDQLAIDFALLQQQVKTVKESCDKVPDLALEVAEIKGKLETQNRLMWFMVLALAGIFIEGLFS